MRKFVGIIGLVILALGILALALPAKATLMDGAAFSLQSLDAYLADCAGAFYAALPEGLRRFFAVLPAFLVLALLGAFVAWWGLRRRERRFFFK